MFLFILDTKNLISAWKQFLYLYLSDHNTNVSTVFWFILDVRKPRKLSCDFSEIIYLFVHMLACLNAAVDSV